MDSLSDVWLMQQRGKGPKRRGMAVYHSQMSFRELVHGEEEPGRKTEGAGPTNAEGNRENEDLSWEPRRYTRKCARSLVEIAPWVKVLASEPDDLSLVPGPYIIDGEN